MVKLPRPLLLDLDDTILDDSSGVVACWRDGCARYCSAKNGLDAAVVFRAIDRTREWYWSDPDRMDSDRKAAAWRC
jgi:hypothetical protein